MTRPSAISAKFSRSNPVMGRMPGTWPTAGLLGIRLTGLLGIGLAEPAGMPGRAELRGLAVADGQAVVTGRTVAGGLIVAGGPTGAGSSVGDGAPCTQGGDIGPGITGLGELNATAGNVGRVGRLDGVTAGPGGAVGIRGGIGIGGREGIGGRMGIGVAARLGGALVGPAGGTDRIGGTAGQAVPGGVSGSVLGAGVGDGGPWQAHHVGVAAWLGGGATLGGDWLHCAWLHCAWLSGGDDTSVTVGGPAEGAGHGGELNGGTIEFGLGDGGLWQPHAG
jgi:hypothetical protein